MKRTIFLLFLLLSIHISAQNNKNHNFDVAKNMDIFTSIYKNLEMLYVDTLDANEVIGTGISAMLRSLDPYTEYYPADKVKDLRMMITGKYAGIGALIRTDFKSKNVIIEEPYYGNPAADAGLQRGDQILAIDDSSMVGRNNAYVSERLRGEAGTSFVLKIRRPTTGKIMKLKITRKAIKMPAVPYYGMRSNNVGYINLSSFTEDCSRDVRRAFLDLKKEGMTSLVFDLRNNGGGALNEAMKIVNMFIPQGKTVLTTKGKIKRANETYKTTVEPLDTIMPMVVLVNGNSASASEIFSGSLQDFDRAVVLGTRTYGKGLVQMTINLPYNGTMKLTTSKYYIPSGRCIQAINYKHSNGGYTEHVPDSLTKIFYTSKGREVRDGGGISPDVEVRPDTLANISVYLQAGDSTETLLNYELGYMAKHKSIAPASEFSITEADFQQFKEQVIRNNFTYDPGSKKVMEELVKIAKFEGYYQDAAPEFEALKKELKHDVARDLEMNKKELMRIINADLVTSYYYQRGAIENTLGHDKQMKKAEELLNSPDEYRQLLMPGKP